MSLLTMQLRSASFRGVSFSVSEAEYNAGRRTALHEYPKRDVPYVEDMGRATRTYTLTALIVGTDYITRTKALMTALEKPGAGRLVHPWLGELSVIATAVGAAKFDTALGMSSVSLTFVEAGEKLFPGMLAGFLSELRQRIDDVLEDISEVFEAAARIAGAADYVVAAAAEVWGEIVALCSQTETLIFTGMAQALAQVPFREASTDPKQFASDVADAIGFNKLANTSQDWKQFAETLATLANNPVFALESTEGLVVDSSDRLIVENGNALKTMMRATLLAQAAGCCSFVGTVYDSADVQGEAETTSYESMIALRETVCDAIDAEILRVEDDELAIELEVMRADVYEAVTQTAEQQARLMHFDFPSRLPLVTAAYEMYEDADRADEIQRLNNVRHIGFSPSGGLKVLSR